MSNRRNSQESGISSLAPDAGQLIPAYSQAPPRPSSSRRERSSLSSEDKYGVNLSERQATTLAMALRSSFTLLGLERPEKIGPMPDSCGELLHAKFQQVLRSLQFAGSFSRLPGLKTWSALLKRIKLNGSVKRSKAGSGRPKKVRESIEALLKLSDDITSRAAVRQLEVSQSTIICATRELDMSWQVQVRAQFLSPQNVVKRSDFAEMLAKIDNGQIDLMNIAWTRWILDLSYKRNQLKE